LLGVNGAGKSTTLSAIAGILKPARGSIMLRDQSLIGVPPEQIVRMGIAMVPEGRDIFPSLTVEENLRLGAFTHRGEWRERTTLEEVFSLFPILQERFNQMGGTLSGGEQQQLAIARSLMSKPKLLMLDEPSLGLAPTLVDQIFDLIVALRQRGATILLVEQNVTRALEIADRAYLLQTGEIQFSGTPEELRSQSDVKRVYLGET
jgi:branched-chain amino acid transport system ATP-binding protein